MKIRKGTAVVETKLANQTEAKPLESKLQVPLGEANAKLEGPNTKQSPLPAVGRPIGKQTKLKQVHIKSRLEKHALYPERNGGTPVSEANMSWSMPYKDYAPVEFTAKFVFEQFPNGWAGPPRADMGKMIPTLTGKKVELADYGDEGKRPLNPMGRTGISGRGILGKWGPNRAGDPVITRNHPQTGELQMLLIKRKDTGEWAIPGGMVDEGETIFQTLARELFEETGVQVDCSDAAVLYTGYADDPRNTDNAWMETSVGHKHLTGDLAKLEPKAKGGDDATAAKWTPMTPENLGNLYGNHTPFVQLAIERLGSQE